MKTSIWFCTLLLALGCDRSEPSESAPPEPEVPVVAEGLPVHEDSPEDPDPIAAPDSPAAEESPAAADGPDVVDTTGDESDLDEGDLDESGFGVTAEDAHTICVDEALAETLLSCVFRDGGLVVPDGVRFDVLEVEYSDMAMVTQAFMVVRTPGEPSPSGVHDLVQAESEPGMEEGYTLGDLEFEDGKVTIAITHESTMFDSTGEPDLPNNELTERSQYVVECAADEEMWDCRRVEED